MSFRDRLRRLREKEEAEAAARRQKREEQRRQEEARKREKEETYRYLEQMVGTRVRPLIDAVNEAYLEQRGEVRVERTSVVKREKRTDDLPDRMPAIHIRLSWYSGYTYKGCSIQADRTEYVVMGYEDSMLAARIPVHDRAWETKLENALLRTISSDLCEEPYRERDDGPGLP